MNIRERIINTCAEMRIIVTEDEQITQSSPGVYLFSGYDKDAKKIKRYKGVDKGDNISVEYN